MESIKGNKIYDSLNPAIYGTFFYDFSTAAGDNYDTSNASNFVYNDNNNMFITAGGFDYCALYPGVFGKKYLKVYNFSTCIPTLTHYTTVGTTINSK